MSVFRAVYQLLIYPVEFLMELMFSGIHRLSGNTPLSIVFLSLAVNLLILPLYLRADRIQAESAKKEKELGPVIKHFKNTFKGDERFLITRTFYRQNDYSPLHVLRSSVSLLLQVPFFLAAYNLLSGNILLSGVSLWAIKDLSLPDGLIVIGGISINVLPVLMTAINILSASVYGNKLPVKTKVQMYLLAGLFLFLLYKSPSGLVLYWTLNNLFSLGKNVVMHFKEKNKASVKKNAKEVRNTRAHKLVFVLSCLILAVFDGLFLPSSVLASSPLEFVNKNTMGNTVAYLVEPLFASTGLFVIWGGILYLLSSDKVKHFLSYIFASLAMGSVLNALMFGNDYGLMTTYITYYEQPEPELKEIMLNAALLLVVILLITALIKISNTISVILLSAILIVFGTVSVMNANKMYKSCAAMRSYYHPEVPAISMSSEGTNVVVIMLDQAIGPMFPYLINEKPELNEAFDGFTYYSNTLSFGPRTLIATPSLYGGYEYTPDKINEQSDRLRVDKHNEALMVMPVLFSNNGYKTVVVDEPLAGYRSHPDLSMYDDYENIKAYNAGISLVRDSGRRSGLSESATRHNLFCYSIFKSSPLLLQPALYDNGKYNNLSGGSESLLDAVQFIKNRFQAEGGSLEFEEEYSVLENLPAITSISEDDQDNFLLLTNETSHCWNLLQAPDYDLQPVVDNTEYESLHNDRYTLNGRTMHMENINDYAYYDTYMASVLAIADWIEFLKQSGVYDNTRIIIVSDHGVDLGQFDELLRDDISLDIESFAPLLLYKDLGSSGPLVTSNDFMTNADTPYLAVRGIIDDPVNPFTNNLITADPKYNGRQLVVFSTEFNPALDKYVFDPAAWYSVEGDIWNADDWQYEGYY